MRISIYACFIVAMIFILSPIRNFGADTVSVSIIQQPLSLSICSPHQFRVNFTLPGGIHTISIRDSINLTCAGISSCNNLSQTFFEVDTSGIDSIEYNNSTSSWEFTLPSGSFSIPFKVSIDCGIIPTCFDSVATSLKLFQIWKAPGLFFNFGLNGDTIISPIFYPRFVEATSFLFNGNYLDTISVMHEYKNTGNTTANIQFSFKSDSSQECASIVVDSILFGVGSNIGTTNFTNLSSGSAIANVPVNESLFINKKIIVKDCLDASCGSEMDTLIWRCHPLDSAFCQTCQTVFNKSYALQQNQTPSISINRVYPDSGSDVKNYTCMGEFLSWKFQIVNSGMVNIPKAEIHYLTNGNLNQLGLVDAASINLQAFLSPNSSFSNSVTLRNDSLVLCRDAIDSALHTLTITIHDFMVGDSLILEFQTYRCCEENNGLYNKPLLFSHGRFDVNLFDSCSNYIYYTDWISEYPSWDMNLEFYPTVTNLVVPTGATFGPSTPIMFVDFESPLSHLNSSYQLFGCPDSICQMKGFLRVNVHCLPGLSIDTPFVSIFNYPSDPFKTWDPVFHYNNSTGICDTNDYFYYFDLADPNALDLIKHGRFKFRLKSCCTSLAETPYQINFDMIFNPDSCFVMNMSDTTHLSPPVCSNCCFLPIAASGSEIAIQCPGCNHPGLEIYSYAMQRINFGLRDSNNNNKADIPMAIIDSIYLSNYESVMRTQFAQHGDLLEDRLICHMPDGDSTGYTYAQMLADGGILNYLQLERKFTPETSMSLNINPTHLKFYVDVPDTSGSGTCLDCALFNSGQNFKTIHAIEADSTQIANYFQTNPPNRLLFTFGAESGTSNLFTNVIYHDSDTTVEFTGFFPKHRYRIQTQYEICSYYSPTILDLNQTVDQQLQEIAINNEGFFCGSNLPVSTYLSFLIAPNNVLPTDILDTSFANSHRFWCTSTGGRLWLYSDETANFSIFNNGISPFCNKFIDIATNTLTGGNIFKSLYPFEFRAPSFKPNRISAFIPAGYIPDTIATINTIYYLPGSYTFPIFSAPQNFSITQTGDSVLINLDSLTNAFGLNCLTDTTSFNPFGLTVGDNQLNYNIKINLISTECNPGAIYIPNEQAIVVNFDDGHFGCSDSINSTCDKIQFSALKYQSTDTLKVPQPGLVISGAPPDLDAGSVQLCWNLSLTNQFAPASNVFIFPPSVSYLSNWYANFSGIPIYPDSNGFIHLASTLGITSLPFNFSLCAQYDTCIGIDTLLIIYGWNCSGYPTAVSDSGICYIDSTLLYLEDKSKSYNAAAFYPSTFPLCAPFEISATLFNDDGGDIYPFNVYLSDMTSSFNVLSAYFTNCNGTDTVHYAGSGPNWPLTDSLLSVLELDTFSTGSCLKATFLLEAFCGSVQSQGDSLAMPNMHFELTTFCNDTIDRQARILPTLEATSFSSYSGSSNCTNCFTIEKKNLQPNAYVNDTITFQIVVCGNNIAPDTLIVHEQLPPFFNVTSFVTDTAFVPASGCDTLYVSGYYTQPGYCAMPQMVNTATIYFNSDSLAASACVEVYPTCVDTTFTIVGDSTFTSTIPTTVSNLNVFIAGRLYVDDLITLVNCKLLINTGGQIIVLPGGSIIFDSTTVEGCDYMWRGIVTDTLGAVTVKRHSIIRDANKAVEGRNGSTLKITNSSFESNVWGIYIPDNPNYNNIVHSIYGNRFGMFAGSFKLPYNGQPSFGKIPFVGIEINDASIFIGNAAVDSNYFYNMNLGILGYRSYLEVDNNKFYKIQKDTSYKNVWDGAAIASIGKLNSISGKLKVMPIASGNFTVDDCKYGIFTDYSSLIVDGVHMNNVNTGILVTRSEDLLATRITNCHIYANTTGIDFLYNSGASDLIAIDNNIYLRLTRSVGIRMSETNNAVAAPYTISRNTIAAKNARWGIVGFNLFNPLISENTVRMSSSVSSALLMDGISINGTQKAKVACNLVVGENPADTNKTAIRVNLTDNSEISCNSVDSTGIGVYFDGANAGAAFRANSMHNHFQGLRLTGSAIINPQFMRGNMWTGTYGSGFGAVNLNSANPINVSFNEFQVNDTLGSIFHPQNFVICVGCQWFVPQAGQYDECSGQDTCMQVGSGNEVGDDHFVEKLIAQDSISTSEYTSEAKSMSRQYLFDKLREYPLLLFEESGFESFMNTLAESDKDYLNRIKNLAFSYSDFSSQYKQLQSIMDSLTNVLLPMVHQNNTLILGNAYNSETLSQLNGQYLLQINQVQTQLKSWLEQFNFYRLILYDSSLTLNVQIQPEDIISLNEKTLNSLELSLKDSGFLSLDQIDQLQFVAIQCPAAGGKAVFRARAMYYHINPEIEYDDRATCLQQGIYRNELKSNVEDVKIKFAYIQPNPASTIATLLYSISSNVENVIFTITDLTGKVVLKTTINSKNSELNFSTKNFQSGMYLYKISEEKMVIHSGKFTVQQ